VRIIFKYPWNSGSTDLNSWCFRTAAASLCKVTGLYVHRSSSSYVREANWHYRIDLDRDSSIAERSYQPLISMYLLWVLQIQHGIPLNLVKMHRLWNCILTVRHQIPFTTDHNEEKKIFCQACCKRFARLGKPVSERFVHSETARCGSRAPTTQDGFPKI